MTPLYYAHSSASADRVDWHRLSLHLVETAARAAASLESTGGAEIARTAGLLHDIGKYTPAFQRRLEGKARVDHSTAGAKKFVVLRNLDLYRDDVGLTWDDPTFREIDGLMI